MPITVVAAARLHALCVAIFEAIGTPTGDAVVMADSLVEANLVRHDTHGVRDIPVYAEAVRAGYVVPDARPEIVQETPTTALVSGRWGFGQVAGAFATSLALTKARQQRIAR